MSASPAMTKLGEITEIVMGQAPPGTDCNTDGRGQVFVKAGEFDERRPIVREWTTNPLKLARQGDVLVCVVGATAGKINEAIDCAIGRSVAAVRPDPNRLSTGYLYHFLQTRVSPLRARSQGMAQGVITREMLQDIAIPLSPLPEQRRIAEILDKADALRAKRRAALAQLDTLTQSIFLDMFGDPATNPKGWAMPSLAELLNSAEVFVDGDWVESKDQDPEGEVRLIQLADVGDGVYLDKSARFLTKQTALRLKCTPLKVGDVLVARMPDPLGRACLFPGDEREAVTVVDVCIIRPATEGPHPVWLMCCINTSAFRSQIAREATGTTRERISRGNLAKLRVISPPRALQESFVRQYQTVSDLRARQRASLEELDGLFASLQHRAFRGEL